MVQQYNWERMEQEGSRWTPEDARPTTRSNTDVELFPSVLATLLRACMHLRTGCTRGYVSKYFVKCVFQFNAVVSGRILEGATTPGLVL